MDDPEMQCERHAGRPRILIVEDESSISDTILYGLESEGFDAETVTTGEEALRRIGPSNFALILLDVGLPDMSGFEVCKQLRAQSNVPVIFLTARSSEIDRVVGLEIGADDYVVKPFSPRELTARVRSVLRRTANSAPAAAQTSGPFSVYPDSFRITCNGAPLDLSRYEFRILKILLESPGRVFTRTQLMDQAWEEPGSALERTVDAHVKSIRAKLREALPDADPIRTHRGIGYSYAA